MNSKLNEKMSVISCMENPVFISICDVYPYRPNLDYQRFIT